MPKVYISPHQKIGNLFLALTILIIIGIIFGFFNLLYGAEIIITPQAQEIDTNFTIQIKENLNNEEPTNDAKILHGKFIEIIEEGEFNFSPKATISMEDYAEGIITLSNNTWNTVTFVPSTRFASPQGLIFRAINKIRIPAKGEIDVPVRADKMGAEYDIGPCSFTIPNLRNANLKKNISAQSQKSMTGGLKKTGIVMQTDIDQARKEVQEKLYARALEKIKQELAPPADFKISLKSDILEEKINAQAGDEKGEFTVSAKIKMQAISFNEKELLNLAIESLTEKITTGKQLASYEPDSLSYHLTGYNLEEKTANLETQLRGYMILTLENEILNKELFLGLDKEKIHQYFNQFPEIQEVKIKLWPSWLLKRAPEKNDRIKIKIKYDSR
ncbi:hypothetical protein B6D52_03005 [Candidatus Parcubacteria bacterium 4484_255]|nr:MAG: hypothetical protein B6D52_03005 [Candidatus Parcubacteria bacterium 4484_255]